jgi:DNA/RNA endonuclease G (NUC1)
MTITINDSLAGRPGYNPDFLNKKIKLPALSAELKKSVAQVSKDVGANGNKVLDYYNFSVVFNKTKKLPFYTVVNVEGPSNIMAVAHESRESDVWYPDPRIALDSNNFQYGNNDYKSSGFQRGHMVRYFDPGWGKNKTKAMGDTFHYTNCCPQIPYYNSVIWNYLEDYYLARAIFQDTRMTVFSGPIFNKARVLNGLLTPVNFWKIVVFNKAGGKISALGFVMSHERYFKKLKVKKEMRITKLVQPSLKPSDIQRLYDKKEIIEARVKISFIEEKTGIKFGLGGVDDMKAARKDEVQPIKTSGAKRIKSLSVETTADNQKEMKSIIALFKAM